VAPRRFVFHFKDEPTARIFSKRVAMNLVDIAIFVEGACVRIIDGADVDQSQEIFRFSMMSGGTQV
jgi:hypothetical protein